jgi:uncharacterized repeat protein (TIGR03803 family)
VRFVGLWHFTFEVPFKCRGIGQPDWRIHHDPFVLTVRARLHPHCGLFTARILGATNPRRSFERRDDGFTTNGILQVALQLYAWERCKPIIARPSKGAAVRHYIRGGASDDGMIFELSRSGKERVLHSFKGGADGRDPFAGLINVNGSLYGTTARGGASDEGTVFKIDPSSGDEEVVYSFKGGSDGAVPLSKLISANGALYGTTTRGGDLECSEKGCGTVFEVTPSGKETVLYRFRGGDDGRFARGGLVRLNGEFYGATVHGGGSKCRGDIGCGTVYEVSPSGKERVLYRLDDEDGALPAASLIAEKGLLYGTTEYGGTATSCLDGCGTVFEMSTSGKERVLSNLEEDTGGAYPEAGLLFLDGKLYGAARGGGIHGEGAVFEVSLSGKYRNLYSFKGAPDGDYPTATLIVARPSVAKRALYGTTYLGGTSNSCRHGCGTVFVVSL